MYKFEKEIPTISKPYKFLDLIDWPNFPEGSSVRIPRSDLTSHNIKSCRGAIYEKALRCGYHAHTYIDKRELIVWR